VYEICGSDPNWEEEDEEDEGEIASRPKVGRNDPCWCGSGKKYKKCHGAN
jgi:preprotein translocase subunit SecA